MAVHPAWLQLINPVDPFEVICIKTCGFDNFSTCPIKGNKYTVVAVWIAFNKKYYVLKEFYEDMRGFESIYFRRPEDKFAENILSKALSEGKKLEEEILVPAGI